MYYLPWENILFQVITRHFQSKSFYLKLKAFLPSTKTNDILKKKLFFPELKRSNLHSNTNFSKKFPFNFERTSSRKYSIVGAVQKRAKKPWGNVIWSSNSSIFLRRYVLDEGNCRIRMKSMKINVFCVLKMI